MPRKLRHNLIAPRIESLESRALLSEDLGSWPLSEPGPSNTYVVQFRNSTGEDAQATLNQLGAYVSGVQDDGTSLVTLGQGVDLEAAYETMMDDPDVMDVAAYPSEPFEGAATIHGAIDADADLVAIDDSEPTEAESTDLPGPIAFGIPTGGMGTQGGFQPGSIPALADAPFLGGAGGMNLAVNSEYSTTMAWADVTQLFQPWGYMDKPWLDNPDLPVTEDGYPLADAATSARLSNYPDGLYKLSYRGTGTVTVGNMADFVGAAYTDPDGTQHATVRIRRAWKGGKLTLSITNIDPNDPVRDMHLYAPGYDETQIFTAEFLRRLEPFSTLRFMDWSQTNNILSQEWSDRTRPESIIQAGKQGVAWEYMIALANTLKKDVWINVPDQADDEYVTQLAGLFRDKLDPGLKIHVEYSNETWNTFFDQYDRIQAAAKADPLLADALPVARQAGQTAYRLMQISAIFKQEFGPDRQGQVVPVLAGQAVNKYVLTKALEFIRDNFGDPSQYFSAVAVGPYVNIDSEKEFHGMNVDQIFAKMEVWINKRIKPGLAENGRLAARYGLPMLAYEGGQSLTPYNIKKHKTMNYSAKAKAQNHPRMSQLLLGLVSAWQASGGSLFTFYSFVSPGDKHGFWGALPSIKTKGSLKWDTLMGMLLPGGDASIDGTVDFGDFEMFRTNYLKGKVWEQGDFNLDGIADFSDYLILERNLVNLTTDQLGQLTSFEATARRFAFGGPTSVVKDGYTPITPLTSYSSSIGFGWKPGSNPSALIAPNDSPLQTDATRLTNGSFAIDLPNGSHRVVVRFGNSGPIARDAMGIYFDGVLADKVWVGPNKAVVRNYVTDVSNGQLIIRFSDMGGLDPFVVLSGLEIY